MPENSPSWLTEPCPAWCAGDHAEGDHPEDHAHRSSGVDVPVVTRSAVLEGSRLRYRYGTAEVYIALHRGIGSDETWVYIGDGTVAGGIEMPFESARRVARTLSAALA